MLPAAYQLPAAVVLILGGLLACFAGYRLFRTVLSIYGFIVGALIASSFMAPGDQVPMLVAAFVGGVIGAVVLNLAYFVGVALVGAGAAALLLHVVWTRVATGDPHIALVVAASAIGAIAAVQLQRLVIVLATAFGGAWTVIVGVLAALGDKSTRAVTATGEVWVAYPLSAGPRRWWVIAAWVVLGTVGAAVQSRTGGKGGGKKKAAGKKS